MRRAIPPLGHWNHCGQWVTAPRVSAMRRTVETLQTAAHAFAIVCAIALPFALGALGESIAHAAAAAVSAILAAIGR